MAKNNDLVKVLVIVAIIGAVLYGLGYIGGPKATETAAQPTVQAPATTGGAAPAPAAPAAPSNVNQFLTTVTLKLDTKDEVAYASDKSIVQPNVTIKYWREASTTPVTSSVVGGSTNNLVVDNGETVRFVYYSESAPKVYAGELSVKAPTNQATLPVEFPVAQVGTVTISSKFEGVANSNVYSLNAGQQRNDLTLKIEEAEAKKRWAKPVVAVAFDDAAFESIKLAKSVNGQLVDYKDLGAAPKRLKFTTAGGEFYQTAFDLGDTNLDDFGYLDQIVVKMKAETGVTFDLSNGNVTFTVMDKAKYLGRDGYTLFEDVETSDLVSQTDITASASDSSLLVTHS